MNGIEELNRKRVAVIAEVQVGAIAGRRNGLEVGRRGDGILEAGRGHSV